MYIGGSALGFTIPAPLYASTPSHASRQAGRVQHSGAGAKCDKGTDECSQLTARNGYSTE
jgi:hypothetical protein